MRRARLNSGQWNGPYLSGGFEGFWCSVEGPQWIHGSDRNSGLYALLQCLDGAAAIHEFQ